jgi:conjugal transfer pilus assembly protein TraV
MIYNKLKKILFGGFIVIMCGLSTACTTAKSTFDCPYGKGIGCHSITEVNQKINSGHLFNNKTNTAPVLLEQLPNQQLQVQRITEAHLRVWIAPFQDEGGNFHEDAIIHAVLRPGFWQVS